MTEKKKDFPKPSAEDQEEINLLKQRADTMGLKYHHRAGLKKMKEIVEAGMNPTPVKVEEPVVIPDTPVEAVKPVTDTSTVPITIRIKANGKTVIGSPSRKHETVTQRRGRLRKEANQLIRVRVSCMNKNKSEWEGEIYTVSNSIVGTLKKFIPFTAENGYYVPKMILQAMQEKKYQQFKTITDRRGNKVRKGFIEKELNIEILPNLTPSEMKDLAAQQALHNNID